MPNSHDTKSKFGHLVNTWTFVAVWIVLMILTVTTVWVAGLNLGELSTAGSMLIATAKGLLVLLFFMHLKYESPVFTVMASLAVATLTVIILLTFTDVWFR
jgi:cytochrome c oxidase subunit 4